MHSTNSHILEQQETTINREHKNSKQQHFSISITRIHYSSHSPSSSILSSSLYCHSACSDDLSTRERESTKKGFIFNYIPLDWSFTAATDHFAYVFPSPVIILFFIINFVFMFFLLLRLFFPPVWQVNHESHHQSPILWYSFCYLTCDQ